MRGMNGTTTPSTGPTSGIDTTKFPEPSTNARSKSSSRSSRPPVPNRTPSYNRTPEAPDQPQEVPSRKNGLEKPTELDNVNTSAAKQLWVKEKELSPKSIPVRPVSSIDEGVLLEGGGRGKDESENLPLDNQDLRSSSVVRSNSARDHEPLPPIATNSAGEVGEDDRTPTIRSSFWGKE